jgi:hypothetical protein
MFGVIVCPRCNRVRGVDLGSKRISCTGCGHGIDVTRAKVYFRTEDQSELAEAVRRMAMEIAPDLDGEDWGTGSRNEREVEKLDQQGLLVLMIELTGEMDGFTLDDLRERTGTDDMEWLGSMVNRMLDQGLIYEPSPGHFKTV